MESGHFDGKPHLMRLSPGTFLMTHKVLAQAAGTELGIVRLRISTAVSENSPAGFVFGSDSEGEELAADPAYEPFSASEVRRLLVVDAVSGTPVAEAGLHGAAMPWELQLPAGHYRLRPWCQRHWFGSHIGSELPIPPAGAVWEFEVRSGETTDFAAKSALGARLELTFGTTATDPEKAYARPVLVDKNGQEVPLYYLKHRWDGGGSSFTTAWPLGQAQTSDRVVAGRYRLRCTGYPTGRVVERSVTLKDGETLKLSL